MRSKLVWGVLICVFLACGARAELRTYRQFKDVAAKENGKVTQSDRKGDLFEYTYDINTAKKTITRINVRRLDQTDVHDDKTVYDIMEEKSLLGSEAGNGGPVLVAVRKDGSETLVLSHRFAFSSRISPFSQVITGVYRRAYDKDRDSDFGKDHNRKPHMRD